MPFWNTTNNSERSPLRTHDGASYGISAESDEEAPSASPEESIVSLTRRTRCLFAILTAPIPPMVILMIMAMVWYIMESIRFWQQDCRHLQAYALCSAFLGIYTPIHYRHRQITRVFVRQWDQCFHAVGVFYIYAGLTLVQTCRRSTNWEAGNIQEPTTGNSTTIEQPKENECANNCPEIFQALTVYVWTLQGLIVCLVLPLLCLPLIYVWFIRRSGDAQTRLNELLREQLQDDDLVSASGRVPVTNVMRELSPVQLLKDASQRIWAVPTSGNPTQVTGIPECCICMEMFATVDKIDNKQDDCIVQAHTCGHLFHDDCIAGWVGGQWTEENTDSNRRARRTTCPLCRADLRPHHRQGVV